MVVADANQPNHWRQVSLLANSVAPVLACMHFAWFTCAARHLTQAIFWLELAGIMNMDGVLAIVQKLIDTCDIRSGKELLIVYNDEANNDRVGSRPATRSRPSELQVDIAMQASARSMRLEPQDYAAVLGWPEIIIVP